MTDVTPRILDCGKSIDELSDYLAADRIPRDPSIESCPECLNVLAALERIARLSRDLIARDIADLPAPPDNWLQAIMTNIGNEARAGRSMPLHHPDPRVSLSVTEGAVRALIRSVADEIPGILIGKCDLDGDVEVAGAPIGVRVTASIAWGAAVTEVVPTLRRLLSDAIETHTELNVTAVDVTIADLHGYDVVERE